jgi:serine/threonine protein kinase
MTDIAGPFVEALRSRYLLERELGRGGMATVFLAQDLKHRRPVALKVLDTEIGATLGPERFEREIHLAARLTHPHIVPVFDSGDTAGRLWYAMPFIAGESLRARLRPRDAPFCGRIRAAPGSGTKVAPGHQVST